jgi:hypothetical protein
VRHDDKIEKWKKLLYFKPRSNHCSTTSFSDDTTHVIYTETGIPVLPGERKDVGDVTRRLSPDLRSIPRGLSPLRVISSFKPDHQRVDMNGYWMFDRHEISDRSRGD